MSNISLSQLLVLALVIIVILPIGSVLAFAPYTIVRLQAKFYRTAYKEVLKQADADIDKPYQLPWDRKLMGKRSEFLSRGYEDPKSYKQLMRVYRIFGFAILIAFSCALMLVAMIVFSRA